jgi:diketogulonate reductase-like aldo/keto reductase
MGPEPSAAEASPLPWMERRTVQGVSVPTMLYGTAWKEERTRALTRLALEAGFRGIDTANQRRHYFEAAVGEGIADVLDGGNARRDDLFLQTKFTFRAGQDHRLPYDAAAPIAQQVRQSFESSLQHLGIERLDALLLHGPSTYPHLGSDDREAWRAMEALQQESKVRLLGVSNVTLEQIKELHAFADVPPALVQNRCFTRPHADHPLRTFCEANGILYQGFSLLTGAPALLRHPTVQDVARRHGRTVAQVVLAYALATGMVVLTGTTSPTHMREDLDLQALQLAHEETAAISGLLGIRDHPTAEKGAGNP